MTTEGITNRRKAPKVNGDFYVTPAWATEALISVEDFGATIWEPACGNGAMSEVLKKTGSKVISSDLYDRGYGEVYDFLQVEGMELIENVNSIVTNPPYDIGEKFIHQALAIASDKVCMLLRLAFLEGVGRYNTLFTVNPPTRVWVFSERITMYPNGDVTAGSGTTAFMWIVWDKTGPYTDKTELKWFPPGFKPKNNRC